MPHWDLRKLSLASLPVAVLLALMGMGYLASSRGKLGGDELLAGWFCLGAPLILMTIAAAFALVTSPYRHPGHEGYCPRCGEWLRGEDLYCPRCGTSAAGWAVPPRMQSDRARDVGPERPVSRRRQHVSIHVASDAMVAAQFIVEQSEASDQQTADLTVECLTDATTARRLYHAAARRLHPDLNDGVQTDDWNRLQEAMDIIRQHHGIIPDS